MLSNWRRARPSPGLIGGDVHVWRFSVAHDPRGHRAMRAILGVYSGRTADSLKFVEGPMGKPALVPEQADGLEFNLSHSGDTALLAVARDRAVGIDIVRHDSKADHAGIARRAFTPVERDAVEAHRRSSEAFLAAFYATWARKEASLKARGLGLASKAREEEPDRWAVFDVDAGTGFSAALVVAKPAGSVELFDLAL